MLSFRLLLDLSGPEMKCLFNTQGTVVVGYTQLWLQGVNRHGITTHGDAVWQGDHALAFFSNFVRTEC